MLLEILPVPVLLLPNAIPECAKHALKDNPAEKVEAKHLC